MLRRLALACAIALAFVGTPASSQAGHWSGEIALATDYRYRGLSMSDGRSAVQAGVTYEHRSGLYAELWGSTLGAQGIELDPTVGYSATLGGGVSAGLSATYYVYPRDGSSDALETTLEIEAERGPWTFAAGVDAAPAQRGTRDESGERRGNLHLFGKAAYALHNVPVVARGEIGRETGPWAMRDHGAKWDWTVGLDWTAGATQFSIDHVGSTGGSETVVGSVRLIF
jgi:uncharacterized protein (TIGR02001 family)